MSLNQLLKVPTFSEMKDLAKTPSVKTFLGLSPSAASLKAVAVDTGSPRGWLPFEFSSRGIGATRALTGAAELLR